MSTETWYVMEDGSVGDPADVAMGKDGKLHHKDGRAVAYRPHGPRSRSVDPEAEMAKAKPKKAHAPDPAPPPPPDEDPSTKDMKAEPSRLGYKTRSTKAG